MSDNRAKTALRETTRSVHLQHAASLRQCCPGQCRLQPRPGEMRLCNTRFRQSFCQSPRHRDRGGIFRTGLKERNSGILKNSLAADLFQQDDQSGGSPRDRASMSRLIRRVARAQERTSQWINRHSGRENGETMAPARRIDNCDHAAPFRHEISLL